MLTSWPAALLARMRDLYGEPVEVDPLRGMSAATVCRVWFSQGSAVVKSSPRHRETDFYIRFADGLREIGVPVVRADFADRIADTSWLLLEDVPGPIAPSPTGGLPDRRIIDALARLHVGTRDLVPDLEPLELAWTDALTETALRALPAPVATTVAPALRAWQATAGNDATWCCISRDANPANWGERDGGSVALFDWELFRRGSPAHDLATTVTGLGDAGAFKDLVDVYVAVCEREGAGLSWNADNLASQTAAAKVETVVQLLAAHDRNEGRVPDTLVGYLAAELPAWLDGLAASAA